MAVIIVVLIAALFLMGFFSIYIRNCSESQSAAGGGSIRQLGRRAAASRGLDPSVIETFPTMVYSAVKGLKIGKGALECAVCLNEFEDDETLRLIPKCDHVFHPECIDAWLESHTTCPVCRADLTLNQSGDGSTVQSSVEPELMAPAPVMTRAASDLEFPRSHSTGHSLVQPGENTDRFTLRLPADVRKRLVDQGLNRSSSMIVLPREGSTRRGYRTGETEGRSDRWVFNRTSSFFARASSFLTRTTSSVRSPRVAANDGSIRSPRGVVARDQGEGSSSKRSGLEATQLTRPPV
ncbi:unnamed protein product [Linum tenue]|uniref:RING-type E3 ubiquitin transferase n=1 Tax=Linum tenue TaxID=586396 RepID=A0AAV0R3W3_9ROSI|nr:unnamed protein product [Linum tenue]